MNLKDKIRTVEDFPKEGISFKDITTVLADPEAFREAIDSLSKLAREFDYDVIIGPEARGFIFTAPIAYNEKKPLVLVRKPGKLPYETVSHEYELEYGTDILEVHKDSIKKGDRVLIIDDLLATGGTTKAMIELVEKLGGNIAGVLFLIELDFLKGRELIKDYEVRSIVNY